MAVTAIQIRRRAAGGGAGAPSALKTAEIAYNMADGYFYVGFGDDGGGNATSIKVFAKDGFVDPSTLYQPLDGDLTAIAALDATAGILVKTGANTYVRRTLAGTSGRVVVTNGDGASGAPTVDLDTVSVGSSVSGGSTKFTVDGYGRITNAGTASLTDLNVPTANYSFGGFRLTNLADPTGAQDAATKAYVDGLKQGTAYKDPARARATANVTISNPGTAVFDGVTLANGERLLLGNQTATEGNGVYIFNGSGVALTRASDMDAWAEVPGAVVGVNEGTTYADTAWLFTANQGGTLGTTSITLTSFGAGTSGALTTAGAGLSATGSTVDVNTGAGITITSDAVALTGQALALHTVTTAADKLIYATGSGTFSTTDFTSVARTLVNQTTQALMRSTGLGLGSMATQAASSVAITGGTIDGVTIDGGTF